MTITPENARADLTLVKDALEDAQAFVARQLETAIVSEVASHQVVLDRVTDALKRCATLSTFISQQEAARMVQPATSGYMTVAREPSAIKSPHSAGVFQKPPTRTGEG